MIEIRNRQRFPVQLVVRSKKRARSFTTLNIPGMGSGNNVYYLEDERTTEYVDRLEKMSFIKTRHIPNREFNKGE